MLKDSVKKHRDLWPEASTPSNEIARDAELRLTFVVVRILR